jgi:hypothetical protein
MARYQQERRSAVVATLRDQLSANMAIAVLRVQGVIAVIELAPGAPPGMRDAPEDGVRVAVAPEDEVLARRILAERGIT